MLENIQSVLEENPLALKYITLIGIILILLFVFIRLCLLFEFLYVTFLKKPLYNHVYFRLKKLSPEQYSILKNEFSFFKKLTPKYQSYFQHRVAKFISRNDFIGKEGLLITNQMKVLVAATATMLTFGYRKYQIKLLDKIVLYPKVYSSEINQALHKGEFIPSLKSILFSWEDFLHGYAINNDNYNLGIHEFVHAIHISNLKENGPYASIFLKSYVGLADYLEKNQDYRAKLISSKYIREYAYTNQFEFVSVLIENFIETPKEFKTQFPEIYKKVKQMLNFNFAGY